LGSSKVHNDRSFGCRFRLRLSSFSALGYRRDFVVVEYVNELEAHSHRKLALLRTDEHDRFTIISLGLRNIIECYGSSGLNLLVADSLERIAGLDDFEHEQRTQRFHCRTEGSLDRNHEAITAAIRSI